VILRLEVGAGDGCVDYDTDGRIELSRASASVALSYGVRPCFGENT
jgi:hypothetical protein